MPWLPDLEAKKTPAKWRGIKKGLEPKGRQLGDICLRGPGPTNLATIPDCARKCTAEAGVPSWKNATKLARAEARALRSDGVARGFRPPATGQIWIRENAHAPKTRNPDATTASTERFVTTPNCVKPISAPRKPSMP